MKLLLAAGEVSSDQHAAALLGALEPLVPSLSVVGLAGDACGARGMRLLAHQKELAVVGLVEALSKVRLARRLIRRLVETAQAERVDAAVLVDSPDFNLPLARRLRKIGVPVVFYVSPQVWAWRSRRAKKIVSRARAVLVLFRFEKAWYDARGLGAKVAWTGHPLVDAATRELAVPVPAPPPGRRRVVVMPGSRPGEIQRLLPLMRDGLAALARRRDDVDVVLVRADSVERETIREVAGPALDGWTVVDGEHLALLAASDALLVASGTATVEGLLARVPMVVVYRVNRLSYWIGKRVVKVPWIAMANLLTRREGEGPAVPELVQDDATAEGIADALTAFLEDPARAALCRDRLAEGAAELGAPGASERAARALLLSLGRPEAPAG